MWVAVQTHGSSYSGSFIKMEKLPHLGYPGLSRTLIQLFNSHYRSNGS